MAACSAGSQAESHASTSGSGGAGDATTTAAGGAPATSSETGMGGTVFTTTTGTSTATTGTTGTTTSTSSSSGTGGSGSGCGQMPDPGAPSPEACGDGLDNDLNGFVDEGCPCGLGQTQACFGGPPSWLGMPNCSKGTQTCTGSAEFPGWGACAAWACGPVAPPPEVCDNLLDDDCDALVDEGCELTMSVNIDGDCIFVSCPPQAPFPVGCNIVMEGGDSRGCVASQPAASLVYFKEGDKCPLGLPWEDAGHISGTLTCSTVPGPGLNATNCPINKSEQFYAADPGGCPQ